MKKEVPPDVLAERYATSEMTDIWSPTRKTILMRELWLVILKAQKQLGIHIPDEVIQAYENVKEVVNRDSIAQREEALKHDVMAEIAEFNALAGGFQHIHRGLTSRDVTDNVEQWQVLQAIKLVHQRAVAVLSRLRRRAIEYQLLDMSGRSHLVPAQATTFGKRLTNIAEEFLVAFYDIEMFIKLYPLRGVKGPMGTQADQVALLGGSENAQNLEEAVREHLGFEHVLGSVGQVYPRSLDFMAVSRLAMLVSALGNFAKMIRLMAGLELAHEGFKGEQAGSSAMPHKVNSRTCERINGLVNVLLGFLDMVSRLIGDQWFEGDVSCSVVRRVVLPGAFYAIDGLFEAAMHVLDEMEIFPAMIKAELRRYQPFLATTALLRHGVDLGLGREDAHKIIKAAAVRAVTSMREGYSNNFLSYLSGDDHFSMFDIVEITEKVDHGRAPEQTLDVCKRIDQILGFYPEAALYNPRELR